MTNLNTKVREFKLRYPGEECELTEENNFNA